MSEFDNSVKIDVGKTSQEDFKAYVEECINAGFNVDAITTDDYYTADNDAGYSLNIFYEDGKVMSITIDGAVSLTFGDLEWPKSDIAGLLPVPKSTIGHIEWEASYGFVINVGETSSEEYKAYVDACVDNGFDVDFREGDDFYYANNENGYHLSLKYEETGDNIMWIRIDEPNEESADDTAVVDESDEESAEDTTVSEEESDTPSDVVGIRPEFQEFMDSYEAFFDEYIEFMNKYSESDDTASMLADYSDFMTKYVEYTEEFSEIGQSELSDEEVSYYMEVNMRVSQKLLEINQ